MTETQAPASEAPIYKGGELVRRHRVSTRIWHWVNAVAIIVMLMSGMMISNAHPHLYWGQYGANFDQSWFDPPRFPGWATIPSEYNLALARHWHGTGSCRPAAPSAPHAAPHHRSALIGRIMHSVKWPICLFG